MAGADEALIPPWIQEAAAASRPLSCRLQPAGSPATQALSPPGLALG
jgi:hypothetical protein